MKGDELPSVAWFKPRLLLLSLDLLLYKELVLAGLKGNVAEDGDAGKTEPYRLEGKLSFMGDKELLSIAIVEDKAAPAPAKPMGVFSSSGGGVGVRGGAGIGIVDAMTPINAKGHIQEV